MEKFDILKADENYAARKFDESEHPVRSKFSRDRDRIVYSKEFRRLNGKTQVFISGFDDYVRNRFTHTIEVSQIAHTISSILGLDKTLTVAIALGHDVGHTPFGHIGEKTLNFILNGCDVIKESYKIDNDNLGFKHNWQSIRVVTELEKYSREYKGINLTDYTLWGILNHSSLQNKPCKHNSAYYLRNHNELMQPKEINICNLRNKRITCINSNSSLSLSFYTNRYNDIFNENSWTIEALVVSIADEIAQRNHDIEDSIKTGIITKKEFLEKIREHCFKGILNEKDGDLLKKIEEEEDISYYLPLISRFTVDFLVTKLIESSKENLIKFIKDFGIKSSQDFQEMKKEININHNTDKLKSIISYGEDITKGEIELQKFIWNRILNSHITQSMDGKASYVIRNLVKAYLTNPMQLPDQTIFHLYKNNICTKELWEKEFEKYSSDEIIGILRDQLSIDYFQGDNDKVKNGLLRTICDFIAGMSDQYAIYQYELLYGTSEIFRSY